MRKIWLLILLALSLSACSSPELVLEPAHIEMLVSLDGEEDDYYEEVILISDGEVINSRRAKWSSENPDIAEVHNGWITSKGVGETTVTATYRGSSAKCTVEVKQKITSDTREGEESPNE